MSEAAIVLDLERAAVGPMAIGDRLAFAEALGPPLKRVALSGTTGRQLLEYSGYQLEFDGGKLVCFHGDPDTATGFEVAGLTLSRSSRLEDVRVRLGEPTSQSSQGGITWVDYEGDSATLALEFDGEGLSCVQLYEKGWA